MRLYPSSTSSVRHPYQELCAHNEVAPNTNVKTYRYSSRQLRTLNDQLLQERYEGMFHTATLDAGAQNGPSFSLLRTPSKTIVVLSPVKDTEQKTCSSGELYSLSKALEALMENEDYKNVRSSEHQILIPLAVDSIGHWETLQIKFKGENVPIEINLYDPKPNLFRVLRDFFMSLIGLLTGVRYSHSYIKESSEKTFGPKNIKFTEYGLGHQDITDHHRCGRYSHIYTKNIIEGQDTPEQLTKLKISTQDTHNCDVKLNNIKPSKPSTSVTPLSFQESTVVRRCTHSASLRRLI